MLHSENNLDPSLLLEKIKSKNCIRGEVRNLHQKYEKIGSEI